MAQRPDRYEPSTNSFHALDLLRIVEQFADRVRFVARADGPTWIPGPRRDGLRRGRVRRRRVSWRATGWSNSLSRSTRPAEVRLQLVVGVHHPNSSWAKTDNGLTGRSVTSASGCMTIPASGSGAGNGLYDYVATPTKPTLTYVNSEYWLSPQYESTTGSTTTTTSSVDAAVIPQGCVAGILVAIATTGAISGAQKIVVNYLKTSLPQYAVSISKSSTALSLAATSIEILCRGGR